MRFHCEAAPRVRAISAACFAACRQTKPLNRLHCCFRMLQEWRPDSHCCPKCQKRQLRRRSCSSTATRACQPLMFSNQSIASCLQPLAVALSFWRSSAEPQGSFSQSACDRSRQKEKGLGRFRSFTAVRPGSEAARSVSKRFQETLLGHRVAGIVASRRGAGPALCGAWLCGSF